jgi:hypothetical protein
LKDNYIRFYLKYIEPLSDRIKNNIYDDAAIEDLINWDTIMGLQFENLVLNNLQSIIRLLQINPNSVLSASPYYQKHTAKQEACQVDLIIRTKYSVYVCEVKFRRKIGKGVIDEVYEKISRIKVKNILSIRPVLIYEGMLSENLLREDFFDRIIRFSDLLVK